MNHRGRETRGGIRKRKQRKKKERKRKKMEKRKQKGSKRRRRRRKRKEDERRCIGVSVGGLQVQTRSQAVGAAHEERDTEQDEREEGYSPRAKEAQSGAPTGKRSHNERLTTAKTRLDVLEASLEELYQGQQRLLRVESSYEEAES
ncbi:hypothetical protein BHE74_00021020 [Ensete ventricosum]|nr:hypothetical protein BHE74_00021020 [Ensete ventricosum]